MENTFSNMIFLDDDPDARFMTVAGQAPSADTLRLRAGALAGTGVSNYIINLNAARVNYPSQVQETYLQRTDVGSNRLLQDIKNLEDAGIDNNSLLIEGALANQVTPWLGFRMNDVHNAENPEHPCHSEFWRKHPELWCHTLEYPTENTLDYTHDCVRQRMFDLIIEAVNRYPHAKGVFLDWMRWPCYFPYGTGEQRKNILTDFTRQVRQALQNIAKTRNQQQPLMLAARVPLHIHNALKLGLDAVAWAKEGLIDWLFIGNFFCGMESDAPVEEWLAAIGKPDFNIGVSINQTYAVLPPNLKLALITPDEIRGVAAAAYWRGAKAVHPFNFMDCLVHTMSAEIEQAILHDILSPVALRGLPRRHRLNWDDMEVRLSELDQIGRLPEFRQRWLAEAKDRNWYPSALPRDLQAQETWTTRLCTAENPQTDNNTLFIAAETAAESLVVSINGQQLVGTKNSSGVFAISIPASILTAGWTRIGVTAQEELKILELYLDIQA